MQDPNPPAGQRSFADLVMDNRAVYVKYTGKFYSTFSRSLKTFWDNLTGFDICRFDEEVVKSPDGTSMRDTIAQRWSEDAAKMISELTSPPAHA